VTSPPALSYLIGAAAMLAALAGMALNVRYARARRGKPAHRRLKIMGSAVAVLAAAMYLLYLAQIAPMPQGGTLLSFSLLALILVLTAGAIANDSR